MKWTITGDIRFKVDAVVNSLYPQPSSSNGLFIWPHPTVEVFGRDVWMLVADFLKIWRVDFPTFHWKNNMFFVRGWQVEKHDERSWRAGSWVWRVAGVEGGWCVHWTVSQEVALGWSKLCFQYCVDQQPTAEFPFLRKSRLSQNYVYSKFTG